MYIYVYICIRSRVKSSSVYLECSIPGRAIYKSRYETINVDVKTFYSQLRVSRSLDRSSGETDYKYGVFIDNTEQCMLKRHSSVTRYSHALRIQSIYQVIGVLSRNFLRCLQLDINSLFLFKVAILGLHIMKNFSHEHRLQFLLAFEYDLVCLTLRHLSLYSMFWSLRFHMRLLNSVTFLYLSNLKEHVWLRYRSLKVVSHSPM